jgi:sugar lactone lactonase YvrE
MKSLRIALYAVGGSRAMLAVVVAGLGFFLPAAAQAQLTFLNTWGRNGSGTSEFNSPTALTVAPDGTVYVTDQNNQRVEYFSPTGGYLGEFGVSSTGRRNGDFSNPSGVAVNSSGTVYVADFRNNDVQLFSETGNYESYFGNTSTTDESGNGEFSGPDGVAVGPTGLVYVTDQGNDRVEIFNSAGVFQSTFGSLGSSNGEFNGPASLAVSSTGLVYVPDFSNNRVEIFTANGVFESSFGTTGIGNGQFEGPLGIGIGPTGLVYVADDGNNRIQVFNSAGVFQSSFGTTGSGNGEFSAPFDVSVNPDGDVYVLDGANNRVQRLFDPNSWTTGTNAFTNSAVGPTSVTVGSGQILGTSLTLTSTMGLTVGSNITINSGGTLTQSEGSISTSGFNVSGDFIYQGGSFSAGSGGFTVNAGGIVQADQGGTLTEVGTSTISGELSLDGGATFSTTTLNINNGGLVAMNQAIVSGTTLAIASGGELELNNSVSSIVSVPTVNNAGLLTGAGQINGKLANASTGQVVVNLGQTLEITGSGNTNAGFIQLGGGAIHYTQGLINSQGGTAGTIEGFGSLRVDGGLSNPSGGTLALAGQSSVTGSVTNSAGALIHLSGNAPNTFFSPVSNAGTLTIDAGASGTFYGAYTGAGPINNYGSVYFNANSVSGTITGNGNLNVGSQSLPTRLQFSPLAAVNQQSSLTLSSGSALDITNNTLQINFGLAADPAAGVLAALTAGYQSGAWTGAPGTAGAIVSSTAATAVSDGSKPILSVGYGDGNVDTGAGNAGSTPAAPGQILVELTLAGDANLDGSVDFNDLFAVGKHLNTTGNDWSQGNFNYSSNGTVDFNDLFIIGQNLNKTINGSGVVLGGTTVPLSQISRIQNTDVLPEPSALAFACAGAAGLLSRRRRTGRNLHFKSPV